MGFATPSWTRFFLLHTFRQLFQMEIISGIKYLKNESYCSFISLFEKEVF